MKTIQKRINYIIDSMNTTT